MSPGLRDYAVALDGAVMTFECGAAGHRYKVDYGKQKPHLRLSVWWLARMLKYWGRAGGGCSAFKSKRTGPMRVRACPQCRKAAKQAEKTGEK